MIQRNYNYDILRIFACFLVVLFHCNQQVPVIGVLTMPCNSLFFMVSGALLLPTSLSGVSFYKRRLSKVLFPTLFFTLFYLTRDAMIGTIDWKTFLHYIAEIPFIPQGHVVLWFMYALLGLYIIAPILSSWIKEASRRELEIILILWFVSCLLPVISKGKLTSEHHESLYYYVGGYIGYFLLGYYLKTYCQNVKQLISLLLIIVSVSVQYIYNKYCNLENLSPITVFVSIGWFLFFQSLHFDKIRFSKRSKKTLVWVSSCCFGIYFIHCFIKGFCQIYIQQLINDNVSMTLMLTFITFIITLLLCLLISLLPFAQYIIGYKHKKQ